MALQMGDRGIRSVAPLLLDVGDPWPCSHCGRIFPRSESWLVNYCHDDGDPYAFVVCPPCAETLTPVSVVIDLAALEALPPTDDLAEIDSLVRFIAERRSIGESDEVQIRWMDLDVLASTHHMTVPEFVEWLRSEGLVKYEVRPMDEQARRETA